MAVEKNDWSDPLSVAGVKLGVAASGIKYADRNDTAVMIFEEGTRVAGVFTKNAFAAAPISICRQHLAHTNDIRALIINSGNANACTGEAGYKAAVRSCVSMAELLSVNPEQILPFSTGVIGELLPIEKLEKGLPLAVSAAEESNWEVFAKAIMTTDTRPKAAGKQISLSGKNITISGVSKGSGMINPNMATMLAYVATDASVSADILEKVSLIAAQQSFNRITIDGDTSTNDSCVIAATGKSGASEIDSDSHPDYKVFLSAVIEVYQSLAKQIVQDGEGATKFIEINVSGGQTQKESMAVAYAIAHSPLIKTAAAASDPNWGRIVAAIGYADVDGLDASNITVKLDDVLIVENGGKASSYREEDGQRIFDQESFTINVDLGRGSASEQLWTSDLTHEYIRINAEYRS